MSERSPLVVRLALGAVLLVALLGAFLLGGVLLGGDAGQDHAAEADETVWTCSMHPQIRKDQPGSCPICGMDLIPASDEETSATPDRVVLSDRARALARIRTTAVTRSPASAELHLLGRVEPDETTRRDVTTWIGGRIERLNVNVTGQPIRRGQVVASLYSPDVYAAHQDLLTAVQQVDRLADSPDAARSAARAALSAARQRLRLLGVPEAELDAMARADAPARTVRIRSPFSGTVIERAATQGAYVDVGATLYRVADLDTLWVQLDAYEGDLPRLKVGQPVSLTVEGLPGETFEGRIGFIDPAVDPRLRTARVRVEVPNPEGALRPGMFAEAVVRAATPDDAPAPLVVPASAPLFTGKRSVVYVEVSDGDTVAYAPRTVRLGPRLGEVYPVVSGLTEGERVVTRGAFALDADLQIRGGPSMMSSPDDRDPTPPALDDAARASLAPIVDAYLDAQRALAEDDVDTAQTAAEALHAAVVEAHLDAPFAEAWGTVSPTLATHARAVADAADIQAARIAFEPLSHGIEALLQQLGNPLDTPVRVAFCPMAMKGRGARWVQQGETIDNVYFGDRMRRCGEIRSTIAPGSTLAPGTP